MSIALNMHSLIRHFEERLRQIDRQNLGDVTGKEPHFPQLVVYLGKDASNAHTAVSTNLLQIWPQYQDELKFLCIQKTDGITYFEMPVGNEQGVALSEMMLEKWRRHCLEQGCTLLIAANCWFILFWTRQACKA